MHLLYMFYFIKTLFVEIIQAFTNLKPYLYKKHTCIYRTHKNNLWNEEPDHTTQETLSISAFLWALMNNLATFCIKTVNSVPFV